MTTDGGERKIELMKKLDSISFHQGQFPYLGIDIVMNKMPKTLIECGGGYSTTALLRWAIEKDAKVITIDLCNGPDEIPNQIGDYRNTAKFLEYLQKQFPNHFKWFREDVYEWMRRERPEIEYYFDDGTHETEYLKKIFKLVIELSKDGAFLGTHDANDPEVEEFIGWAKENPYLVGCEKAQNSYFMRVMK